MPLEHHYIIHTIVLVGLIVGCLTKFFSECNLNPHFLNDPQVLVFWKACNTKYVKWALMYALVSGKVKNLYEILSPVFYRKMPQRLAKRLSAGFQDKESKPQVRTFAHYEVVWQ